MIVEKADLHTHSTCSDGTFSPRELIVRAKEVGLTGLSITDHDTIAAYPEAFSIAKEHNIALIPGVELSCFQNRETVHILGYSFDPQSDIMLESTSLQRLRRLERNREILKKLKSFKMPLEESDISSSDHPTYAYGRVHIAMAMVSKGYVASVVDAFRLYLGDEKSCYVEGAKWSVEEGIDIIRRSKGLAVLAHPHLISSASVRKKMLQMPFDGIEAYYSRACMRDNEKWLQAASKNGWFVTGGSDFHGDIKPDISLGCSYTPPEVFVMLQEHFHGL